MPTSDVVLTVAGKAYEGWKTVRVTRSIESIAGSFELSVSDSWPGSTTGSLTLGIAEEAECQLEMAGQRVITGYVDKRSLSIDGTSRSITVSGRDKAGMLVDCSANPGTWLFRKTDLKATVEKICKPLGIAVTVAPDLPLKLPPREKLGITPGDTAWSAIEKITKMLGCLAISDGQGGILLIRTGTILASTALVQGQNILKASAEYDASIKYFAYQVLSANASTMPKKDDREAAKSAAKTIAIARRAKGEAFDDNVTRTQRILIINPDDGANKKYAEARAQWEANVRAAKSDKVTVTVVGWTMDDGTLWPINVLVPVTCPKIGISGQMLITQAKYTMDEGGRKTELSLKRPDSFTPAPRVPQPTKGAPYKELVGGV
jgi:prophage tail gpP-like protein